MTNLSPAIGDMLSRYPALAGCIDQVQSAGEMMIESLAGGGCLLVCGNGGSAADSEHIVGELLKRFMRERPLPVSVSGGLRERFGADGAYLADHLEAGLRAVALTGHMALSTAMGNDVSGDLAFAQQVLALAKPGDVLLGISTSGNARNVAHAMRVAAVLGVRRIGLTGAGGGTLASLCEVSVRVPSTCTPEIQELHLPIYHALCRQLEDHFFCEGETE